MSSITPLSPSLIVSPAGMFFCVALLCVSTSALSCEITETHGIYQLESGNDIESESEEDCFLPSYESSAISQPNIRNSATIRFRPEIVNGNIAGLTFGLIARVQNTGDKSTSEPFLPAPGIDHADTDGSFDVIVYAYVRDLSGQPVLFYDAATNMWGYQSQWVFRSNELGPGEEREFIQPDDAFTLRPYPTEAYDVCLYAWADPVSAVIPVGEIYEGDESDNITRTWVRLSSSEPSWEPTQCLAQWGF